MRKSRFRPEQIIGLIKQAEAGLAVTELCRRNGFSDATFYKWRAKYGGMEVPDAPSDGLEPENGRLKKLLAEAHLHLKAMKIRLGAKATPPVQRAAVEYMLEVISEPPGLAVSAAPTRLLPLSVAPGPTAQALTCRPSKPVRAQG